MLTASDLLRRKGPEEPIKPRGLGQSASAYIMGREDFLYRKNYQASRLVRPEDRQWYHCGWAHEQLELDEMSGRRFGDPGGRLQGNQ